MISLGEVPSIEKLQRLLLAHCGKGAAAELDDLLGPCTVVYVEGDNREIEREWRRGESERKDLREEGVSNRRGLCASNTNFVLSFSSLVIFLFFFFKSITGSAPNKE